MADSFGQADISKNSPVPSSSGIEEDDYHKGRTINLVAEEKGLVSSKMQDVL